MRLLPPMFIARSAVSAFSTATDIPSKQKLYPTLTGAQLPKARSDALADELNTLYKDIMSSLGSEDARYIQRVHATVVYSEIVSRGLLAAAGRMPSKRGLIATLVTGTSLLSFSRKF